MRNVQRDKSIWNFVKRCATVIAHFQYNWNLGFKKSYMFQFQTLVSPFTHNNAYDDSEIGFTFREKSTCHHWQIKFKSYFVSVTKPIYYCLYRACLSPCSSKYQLVSFPCVLYMCFAIHCQTKQKNKTWKILEFNIVN